MHARFFCLSSPLLLLLLLSTPLSFARPLSKKKKKKKRTKKEREKRKAWNGVSHRTPFFRKISSDPTRAKPSRANKLGIISFSMERVRRGSTSTRSFPFSTNEYRARGRDPETISSSSFPFSRRRSFLFLFPPTRCASLRAPETDISRWKIKRPKRRVSPVACSWGPVSPRALLGTGRSRR